MHTHALTLPALLDTSQYKQSIYMGDCGMEPREVHDILATLMDEWKGHEYRLLDHNCCTFR